MSLCIGNSLKKGWIFFFFFLRGIIGWLLLFIFASLVERVSVLEIYSHS